MKRTIGLISAVTMLAGIAATPVYAQTPAAGPVGHWTLDDASGSKSAADSSGHDNPAKCGPVMALGSGMSETVNCPDFGVPGKIGSAADFQNIANFLVVNNTVPDSFTISAWVRTTQAGDGDVTQPAYAGNAIIWSDISGAAADMIPMSLEAGHLAFGTGDCNSDKYDTLVSSMPINTGKWVFVAVTRDQATGEKQLYIDGKLDGQHADTGTCALDANKIITFGGNPLDDRYFEGQLDDIRFYDRVLSGDEIVAIMTPAATSAKPAAAATAMPAAATTSVAPAHASAPSPMSGPPQSGEQAPPPASAVPLPDSYSITIKPTPPDDMSVAVYRDGPREVVRMSRPVSSTRPKAWTSNVWYDFQAHRQYATDSNAPNQCSVIKYTSAIAPPLQDPVVMSAQMGAQMPPGITPAGNATIDGMNVAVLQTTTPDGTIKIWKDTTHNLIIKATLTPPGGAPPQTIIDLTGISFAKPDPALLTPPQNCKMITGESNANGGHAEVPIHPH